MVNVIGTKPANLQALQELADCDYIDYGKSEREGRKLGHVNTRADSYPELTEKIATITTLI
jgi:5-(carboxyamino)imidazole ribonucleotide synthase